MEILQSHKNQLAYFEHAKIVKIDEKVAYIKDIKAKNFYFSIPYANTSVILLGPGTSITQSAMHHLASENVMIAFTGGDGFPIFCGTLSEYRPTQYCQKWIIQWQDEKWRLKTAKKFQTTRIDLVKKLWIKKNIDLNALELISQKFRDGILKADSKESLLGYEANYAKALYGLLSKTFSVDFRRKAQSKEDHINDLIDTHNYYAYSLASTTLWTLGIPFAFPVLHGETRKGGLVFDVADMIKDAFLLPIAFESYENGYDKSIHKKQCADVLNMEKVMNILFDEIKEVLC